MTSAQTEATDVEVLAGANPAAVAETSWVDALAGANSAAVAETSWVDALAGANPDAAAEVTWVEVLASYVGTTSEVGSVYVEVLIPSQLAVSNIFDSTGTQRQAYRWDGTSLVPVVFQA